MVKANNLPLGRGLEALLGDEYMDFDDEKTFNNKEVKNTVFKADDGFEIPIEKIERCSFQPRTEFDDEALKALSNSIKEKGVLQPILVRKLGEKYQIVAGERRFQAAKTAGLKTIPAIMKDLNDSETLEIALIENIQRENLSAIEEAKGLNKLLSEYGHTQENLGKIIGKSRVYITNTLRLLNLPEKVQKFILEGKLSAGHARSLIGLPNAVELAEKIISEGLSVRETEKLVSESKFKPVKIHYVKAVDTQLRSVMNDLEQKLGLKVKINAGKKGNGSITLKYENPAQLSALLDILEQR